MNRERPPPEPERLFGTHIPSRGHVLSKKCEKGIFLGGSLPTTRLVPVQHRETGNDFVKVVGIRG